MRANERAVTQPGTMTCAQLAAEWVGLRVKGWDLLLQFTCPECGAASFHTRPNELPPRATCEACGAVVDVEATGGWFGIVRQAESEEARRATAERRRDLAAYPVDAVADMETVFAHHDLPKWPIPAPFRPALCKPDDWLWTTRDIDPMAMYMFSRYTAEATRLGIADYLAISHAGHGVNSYALNYHLVLGPLALFAQVLWGGVYVDDDSARQELAREADLMRRLIPLAEEAARDWDGRRRLLVAESHFRGVAVCYWVDLTALGPDERLDPGPALHEQRSLSEDEDGLVPLEIAIREFGGEV
jgi:hypothetical protein